MLNRLQSFAYSLAYHFILWMLDESEFADAVEEKRIEELPLDERADPLGIHTHAASPVYDATDIVWHCPQCGAQIAENAFDGHVESHRTNVWGSFINSLDFYADPDATKPYPHIQDMPF